MGNAVEKVKSSRNADDAVTTRKSQIGNSIMLTERGSFFGYNRLVNDFTGLSVNEIVQGAGDLRRHPQHPTTRRHGDSSGGNPQYAPMLARAAVATGCVDGLFIEVHPTPKRQERRRDDPAVGP